MRRRGFTLVEILSVVAIMTIVMTIIVTGFSTYNDAQVLDRDTETIVEALATARSRTLSSENAMQYGVHVASTSATVFSGVTFSPGASDNQEYPFIGRRDGIRVTLDGGGNDIVFSRLSGNAMQSGTITVSSPVSSRTRTVTVYKTGLIEYH